MTWVPESCALPTAERPLRTAEFDRLFATAVRRVDRIGAERVALELRPEPAVAAAAADLIVRETACCEFFTFALVATAGQVRLDVSAAGHTELLAALAARADALAQA